jgi:2-methylisocitrate lyase-like PEP mutase family enzyme
MAINQQTKATAFAALHKRDGVFVIPNPWDIGSARILAAMGFEALATTSAGMAFALGLHDGGVTREQVLDHCRDIVSATDLPVSADLEQGFGDSPDAVAKTIRAAAETGLAGCSIEDYSGARDKPIYDFDHAVERIAAAVEAARSLPFDFTLTARSENFLRGNPDLDDTMRRLQAFEATGADVLYAPGLTTLDQIRTVCSAVEKPVNVVMEASKAGFGVAELADAGVKRISVGAIFARAAYGEFIRAAKEISTSGIFNFADDVIGFKALDDIFRGFATTDPGSSG